LPYLCRVTISGPEPDAAGVSEMTDALADAVQAGWEAPRLIASDDEAVHGVDEVSSDGAILDCRVLGYPGGATILVVLDGTDLMQTSVAVTGLAHHLTTWSPGLLQYSADEVRISKIDKPRDDGNWLPPIEALEEEFQRPRWPLAEILGDELKDTAAHYLLACAIRSLWHPSEGAPGRWAEEVVAGAVEQPWRSQLPQALGVLLIRAARWEQERGSNAPLVVQGSGDTDLAAELLRRARRTAAEPETEGWADDKMRGHLLVERFVEDHQLTWKRVQDDEPAEEYEHRSNRQLRALLWAGLRSLATLTKPLADLSGPWQMLDELDDNALVSILAHNEEEEDEAEAEEDIEALESAAAAHALVWLAIRHPEGAGMDDIEWLIDAASQPPSPLHHVVYEALLLAGAEPLKGALTANPPSPDLGEDLDQFASALSATERVEADHEDASADNYDEMHVALERILGQADDRDERVRYLLALTGMAAQLTETETNPRRGVEGYVSSPQELANYLLSDPATHAVLELYQHDAEDEAVRAQMLALVAQVAPAAAGGLAAEMPDLMGDDPRLETASRSRARQWIEDALRMAEQHGQRSSVGAGHVDSPDAQALVTAVMAGGKIPDEWPAKRIVAAAAEAAAAILHSIGAPELTAQIFTRR
jgi:hypothetical protein